LSVSEEQFKKYIETFLRYFMLLTNLLNRGILERNFPKFLRFPYRINGTISSINGVSIEFLEESNDYDLEIGTVKKPIEDAILPQENCTVPVFEISNNRFIDIVDGIVVTKEFREKYVKKMEGGIIAAPPVDGFLHVSTGGDVKFHNTEFYAILKGKPICKKAGDCLWIYGSNLKEDFTVKEARKRALEEFNVYLATHIYQAYRIGLIDKRREAIETLTKKVSSFEELINKPEIKEKKDLQGFFEQNPEFLFFGTRYRKIFPQVLLRREKRPDLTPDFFLERVIDGYCDILDIKLPGKKVLVGPDERRRFTYEVQAAIAQVDQYREYFEDPQNIIEIEKNHGIKVYKPNILVLIGDSKNIDVTDFIRIRDRQKYGEVITYSELLRHMRALLDLLKS